MQDGYFTFSEMECMGSCVNAPMIAVADYTKGVDGFSYIYYEDLSPHDAVKILDNLKARKTPRVVPPPPPLSPRLYPYSSRTTNLAMLSEFSKSLKVAKGDEPQSICLLKQIFHPPHDIWNQR